MGCNIAWIYHNSALSARPATLTQRKAKQVCSSLVLLSAHLMLGATICSQCNLTFLEIKVGLAAIQFPGFYSPPLLAPSPPPLETGVIHPLSFLQDFTCSPFCSKGLSDNRDCLADFVK